MNAKERQDYYECYSKNEWFLDYELTFDDCNDPFDVEDAVCKMLQDNFDIAHEKTYIKEIIGNGITWAANEANKISLDGFEDCKEYNSRADSLNKAVKDFLENPIGKNKEAIAKLVD